MDEEIIINGDRYRRISEPTEWEVVIPFHSMDKNEAIEWRKKIAELLSDKLHLNEIYLKPKTG